MMADFILFTVIVAKSQTLLWSINFTFAGVNKKYIRILTIIVCHML